MPLELLLPLHRQMSSALEESRATWTGSITAIASGTSSAGVASNPMKRLNDDLDPRAPVLRSIGEHCWNAALERPFIMSRGPGGAVR